MNAKQKRVSVILLNVHLPTSDLSFSILIPIASSISPPRSRSRANGVEALPGPRRKSDEGELSDDSAKRSSRRVAKNLQRRREKELGSKRPSRLRTNPRFPFK